MFSSSVTAISSLTATEWDSLVAEGDLFCSHAWLRHLDEASAPHSAVVVRRSGRSVAAMPFWEPDRMEGNLFRLSDFFPDLPALASARLLWAGARRAVRNGVVCETGPSRSPTATHLLSVVLDHALAAEYDGVIVPYLPVGAAEELAAAHPRARVLLHSADATVHVLPHGTAGPSRTVSAHNRKRRRREIRDFFAAGHTVEWTGLTADIAAEVAPLIANVRSKYGGGGGVDWMNRVFEAQRKVGLDESAAVLLCRRDGVLVTTAVCYHHGDALHGRYFGADESAGRAGSPYFFTTCHGPVAYAAQSGLRRVHLSTSSLEAKVRRGATLEPLAAVALLRDEPDAAGIDSHNRKFATEYHNRFAGHQSALGPAWSGYLD
ncbi:peptidogalycan biosysnthesis protein [Nocardia jinanensis]|uniref:GNAT family N-acetyltransferase n=1 Tax=Nocardia jinanensis TaxID=382504 RepID=A0A917RJK7_9NOCA|nr:peptidogalycan biosysnthesis protein [Nocardia jinanensis]GGL11399.1 hypothetical protein GCM10011588_27330 [Nocardia jinanensis]